MREKILPFVLKNAYDYDGSVNAKAVLGLVLRDNAELKKDVPGVLKEIENIISEVQGKSKDELKKELENIAPELLVEKKVEKIEGPLKPLKNAVKGKVVLRIAPSPSGALHVGHAYGMCVNNEYAKMYEGKLLLRIEDTNPENIYPKAYELIEEDAKWLTNDGISEVIIQSDRLDRYYECARQLVDNRRCYVCTCDADEWRTLKNDGKACPCRDLPVDEQQERYEKMFNGYVEGEAVLRLKTDIEHKNPAMRDFGIMRINRHKHPKTGTTKRVWPLMVFSVAVDDHDFGVTHVLNGKDHADNAKKEAIIMKDLGWDVPEYQHWGRINFEGMPISSSKTRLAIEQNEFTGWDDLRLPFLPALRRRGYQPHAFAKFAIEIGLSLTDKTVAQDEFWKMINSFNKEIVEEKANRYFFVEQPIEFTVKGASEKKVELELHPDFPKRGKREFSVNEHFLLAKNDEEALELDRVHRLMDCCNFANKEGIWEFVSEEFESYKSSESKGRIIHWLPANENLVGVEVLDIDEPVHTGKGESSLSTLEIGSIVQFERMYFARLDEKRKDVLVFAKLHK